MEAFCVVLTWVPVSSHWVHLEPLPLESQDHKTKLVTCLLSLSPTVYLFTKSLHELESIFQAFPCLFHTFLKNWVWGETLMNSSSPHHPTAPPAKLPFSFLSLGKAPDLHKQSCQFLSSQPSSILQLSPNSLSGHFVSSLGLRRSQSPCGVCPYWAPCPWFTQRVDLSNHLIIVSLPSL